MEKEIEDKMFWNAVEKVVGKVNAHIRNILSLQGLVANKALGTLTLVDIMEIENDMRGRASLIKDNLSSNAELHRMSEYYGMHSGSPENFRFTFGDKRVIEMIAQAVHEKGIHWFQRETADETPDEDTHTSDLISLEIDGENLIKRLRYQFSKKGIDVIYPNLLDGVEVEVKKMSGARRQGIVKCPICGGKRSVTREPNQSWKTFNVERHVMLHSQTRAEGMTRKRSQITPSSGQPDEKRPNTTMIRSTEDNEITTPPIQDPLNQDVPDPMEFAGDSSEQIAALQESYNAADYREVKEMSEYPSYAEERIDDPLDQSHDRTADGNNSGESSGYHPGDMEDQAAAEANEGDESNIFALLEDAPVLKTLAEIHIRTKDQDPHGRRFTTFEKDICSYEYLNAGNSHYQYLTRNMSAMSKKTIQRHLQENTFDIREGVIDVKGLKKYLTDNNFPLAVILCEDGTRITPKVDYDCATNSLRGLVSPLNKHGLPDMDLFVATTPFKMAEDIKNYPVGNYAYIQMATPLCKDAAPYVLYHVCTDNRFSAEDVQNRWDHTVEILQEDDIEVVGFGADGDPRVHKRMKINADFDLTRASRWGSWFVANDDFKRPSYYQDMTHTVQKMKNRFVHSDKQEPLKIGNYNVTTDHLKKMMETNFKDEHRLTISDINTKDRMRFGPTMKLMNPEMTQCLLEAVPGSRGTVLYLNTMRRLYNSFSSKNFTPEERILDIWTATLTIRGWRNWCIQQPKGLKQFITSNTYVCIELDAHALILFLTRCRELESPEQFVPTALGSQHCESFFRQLRSETTTNETAVNFSVKELSERIRRIHHKTDIMYKHKDKVEFPAILKMQQRSTPKILPSDEEITKIVDEAHFIARNLLKDVGIIDPNFEPSSKLEHKNDNQTLDLEEDEDDPDIHEEEELITDTETDSFCDEVEFVEVEEHSDAFSGETGCDVDDNVYDLDELFPECNGKLHLKSTTSGNKHTFRLKDRKGNIKTVKKSTLVWMMTGGRYKLSTDRTRRFTQKEYFSADRAKSRI